MSHDRSLLRVPDVAWPTLLLAAAALSGWVASLVALATGALPAVVCVGISTVCAFVCFTPMHDATHKSVGRAGWLNDLVGRVCGVPLMAPYPAFRHLHLSHHRHTNDPDADPDHWAGRGPSLLLPLRWLTQDLHYYARYLPRRDRPTAEYVESLLVIGIFWGLAAGLLASPWGGYALLGWVLPARLGIALLSCTFDYLPHRPHGVLGRDDRFAATVNFRGLWAQVLLLNQSHHLVHHLFPAVPFYRYHLVWRARRAALEARGARQVSLLDPSWWRDPSGAAQPAAQLAARAH